MEKYLELLRRCPLFAEIASEDLLPLLGCLGASVGVYTKHEPIFSAGDAAISLGIVLSGAVQITRIDYSGNRSIMAQVEPAQLFGESFACAEAEAIPVDVVAAADSEILFLPVRRITSACSHACSFHSRIIFNLMKIIAVKNLAFHQKIEITSKRTTREKLLAYLFFEAKKNNSNRFSIPYDRQALADYLCVDRSGLSAEIGKLRREGILRADKNRFILLTLDPCTE